MATSSSLKLAVAGLLLAYAPGALALCRCSCGGRSASMYDTCSAFSCERRYGFCPYGWRAYNQNGGIIGGSVGGFFFLLMLFCCCCLLLRRRRRMRGGMPMVQEIRLPPQHQGMSVPYAQQQQHTQFPQPAQPPTYPPPAHDGSSNTLDGSSAHLYPQHQQQQYAPPPGPPPPQKGGMFNGLFKGNK
ncbi:hypothetical protein HDU86_004218 [Geranomyces michiganensis]|nr:hypothetical protein HDU86_004218 [Geranomyces michiganensis]